MAGGAGEYEQVPGEVCIANAMRCVEANAGGVGYATRENP
jgi:hypothetical protein